MKKRGTEREVQSQERFATSSKRPWGNVNDVSGVTYVLEMRTPSHMSKGFKCTETLCIAAL